MPEREALPLIESGHLVEINVQLLTDDRWTRLTLQFLEPAAHNLMRSNVNAVRKFIIKRTGLRGQGSPSQLAQVLDAEAARWVGLNPDDPGVPTLKAVAATIRALGARVALEAGNAERPAARWRARSICAKGLSATSFGCARSGTRWPLLGRAR